MKKFLSVLLVSSIYFSVSAQNCITDTTITEPGIYPEILDTAYVNKPYTFTIQVLAIKDTTADLNGTTIAAQIDSIRLEEIIGLPSGFSYSCEPNNCVFTYKDVGCIKLTGNPSLSDAGIRDLEIITTAYASAGILKLPVKDTIRDYQLVVKDTGALSVLNFKNSSYKIYPNPIKSGRFIIASSSSISKIKIVDIQGRSIDFKELKKPNGVEISLQTTAASIYFIQFKSNGRLYKKRVVL